MKKKVLISTCLLGRNCRYNGRHSYMNELDDLNIDWVPVCPEEAGGLGTPRPAAEMQGNAESILSGDGNVVTNEGRDVTEKFIQGAKSSLEKGLALGAEFAVLKSRSPSCGIGRVYDGSFTHSLKDGDGVFAHLCFLSGMRCISSDDINEIKRTFQKQK